MEKNVGKIDKTLRLVIGIALILIGLTADIGAALRVVALVFASVALFTGLYGF